MELERAFREKHDPQGFSTASLREAEVDEISQQLGSPSLFSPKRFLRVDGILERSKIADVRQLVKKIAVDADQTILVTIEEEPPTQKILDEFKSVTMHHYPFVLMHGSEFRTWCALRAEQLGIDRKISDTIADRFDGDTWTAEQELQKKSANTGAPMIEAAGQDESVFVATESYVKGPGWRKSVEHAGDEGFVPVLLSQVRNAVRIQDGATQGIHPFVVKKMSSIRRTDLKYILIKVARALVAERSGLAQRNENVTLL